MIFNTTLRNFDGNDRSVETGRSGCLDGQSLITLLIHARDIRFNVTFPHATKTKTKLTILALFKG